jgi:hypothetical protein
VAVSCTGAPTGVPGDEQAFSNINNAKKQVLEEKAAVDIR